MSKVDDQRRSPATADQKQADTAPDRTLFPMEARRINAHGFNRTGILSYQELKNALDDKFILSPDEICDDQIQPASIDLRLDDKAYRVRASFLPGRSSKVQDKISSLTMHEISLGQGAVLERGCVYIIPLKERLSLRKRFSAHVNPKSSTGRLDIFTRVISDNAMCFDRIAEGYKGRLYAEVAPRTFSVIVREGDKLCQIRLRHGTPGESDSSLWRLHAEVNLVDAVISPKDIQQATLPMTVDLRLNEGEGPCGYRAKHHAPIIDIAKTDYYDREEFWDEIFSDKNNRIILNPNDFYILASKEAVKVPPDYAAEMVAYDTMVGEFRVHYAGFFDPGFGDEKAGGAGSRAVLEVRSHEVPFMIEDGQLVGRIFYERLTSTPDKLYGVGIGSSYQAQGLMLAKQFRRASVAASPRP